jgi:UDPglucose 6-dehydrogenase
MRVAVIGAGHVGLVTAVTIAQLGHDVMASDNDPEKIAELDEGRAPFFEPGLEDAMRDNSERLKFTSVGAEAIADADVVFVCVGTPPRASGEANLAAVEQVAREIARHATGRTVVVDKSTVPAGTARRVLRTLARERPELAESIAVVSSPEFLREGKALEDSLNPERILVGGDSEWAFKTMRTLYRPLLDKGCELIETDIETAELAKHACNAFLALKISFANALARICELSGADVVDVARVMGADPRIGPQFLRAGIGYGGYCFPKDLQAFERLSSKLGYEFPLLKEIERINNDAVDQAVAKVNEAVWNLEDKRIALWGLSFKPETDDTRFSPALAVARRLLDEGAQVVGYDPQAGGAAKAELPDLEVASDMYEAARGAHCLVLCTEWNEFATADLARLKEEMSYPVIVDGRNLFDPKEMERFGFTYYPTGRPAIA